MSVYQKGIMLSIWEIKHFSSPLFYSIKPKQEDINN